jgi:predicted ester cyclase
MHKSQLNPPVLITPPSGSLGRAVQVSTTPRQSLGRAVGPTLLLACLSACGSADVEQPAAPPIDPRVYKPLAAQITVLQKSPVERNRESADAVGRAIGKNDQKALSELLDPDVDFTFPGKSDATDRPGTLKALDELFGAFSSRTYAADRVWQIGEAIVVEWAMKGTHSSPWMGVAPTQKEVAIRGVTLQWFNLNGLINEVHVYFDCGSVLAQMGASPNKSIEAGPAAVFAPSPVVTLASGNAEEKANVGIVNASWDALEAKNEAGYLAPMLSGIEVTRADRTAVETGKEERKKFFHWVVGGVSSLSQTPMNAWGAGNFVIEEYTITGVHSGKLTPQPPSGHALRLHYLDIDEMQGGKIVRTWTYGNVLELYAETGAVPSAAPGPPAPPNAAPPPMASAR